MALTLKQKIFAEEYLIDLNATRAYTHEIPLIKCCKCLQDGINLIENCKTYDAKDARLTSDANQMHIQTIYQDIELDAQDMETEYQAAFEDLLWFVDQYLASSGQGDFEQEEVDITFNRNILVNETELIENCMKLVGFLPTKLILQKHPWVDDVEEALKLTEEEEQKKLEQMDYYQQAFAQRGEQVQEPEGGERDGEE